MASTKQSVINTFRSAGFYPDCPEAVANSLFNDAARTILKSLRVRNAEVVIALVAGQREYSLSDSVLGVVEAYYERSDRASEWALIEQATLDALARGEAGWRVGGVQGIPTRMYVGSGGSGNSSALRVGFDPIPSTSSAGGFPRIRLYVTEYAELTSEEFVYSGLLTNDVYFFHMARAWARRQEPERAQFWEVCYHEALAEESAHVRGRAEGAVASRILSPFAGRLRGQV